MPELDKLWCTLRDIQERCTELEVRVSLLEDDGYIKDYPYEDLNAIPKDWANEGGEYPGLLGDRPNDSDITPERWAEMEVTDE